MKYFITLFVALTFLSCKQNSNKIGKYNKAALPPDFSYKILEDNSNVSLDKNALTIQINKKISVEQIATIADELYSSKNKQRRFYIFYLLPDMKINTGAWATSHFDPELDIQIIGATVKEEETVKKIEIEGAVILGKWYDENVVPGSTSVLYKKGNKLFMRLTFKNGQKMDSELKEKNQKGLKRLNYVEDMQGEYFVIEKTGELGMYNKANKQFGLAKIYK